MILGGLTSVLPEEMIESYFVKYGVAKNLENTQDDLVDGQQDELVDDESCAREVLFDCDCELKVSVFKHYIGLFTLL